MAFPLPPLRFTGAHILRDGALQARSIAVAEGRITRGPHEAVDLSGYWILPGIVDLCATPLPGETPDAQATRLAAQGITTAWRLQGWSWESGADDPAAAEATLASMDAARALAMDLRLHLRVERVMVDTAQRLLATIDRHSVGLVTLSDRAAAFHDRGEMRQGLLQPRQDLALRQALLRWRDVPRHLCRLAEAFDQRGVIYGSLGDRDGETREHARILGARLAVQPASRAAAATAKAMNDPVFLSAADLTGQNGQERRHRALALVQEGLCDAILSGDAGGDPCAAAIALVDAGHALPAAWERLSQKPAECLGLHDRGHLDQGARADLVLLDATTGQVAGTICAGHLVHATPALRARLGAILPTRAAQRRAFAAE